MRRMLKSFRFSQDEETKEKFRTAFFFYPEMVCHVEEYPYDCFASYPGGKCYVYFSDGSVVILNEDAEKIASIVNGTNLAAATGRTSLINSQ